MAETSENLADKALRDFKRAYTFKRRFLQAAQEDIEFALGDQWDETDVQTLKDAGVRALTINKIRPNLFLLTGIESQNRSEYKAYPEGREDSVRSEIATGLLKNVMKTSNGDYKISEAFDEGLMAGEVFIEPWVDYTWDLLNGEMKFRKNSFFNIFVDPQCKEYDLSDAEYVCKITYDLTKDQLKMLYPDKEDVIDKMTTDGKINLDTIGGAVDEFGVHRQARDYGSEKQGGEGGADDAGTGPLFDLLEYQYKHYVAKWFVLDFKAGNYKEAANKEEAENFVNVATAGEPDDRKTAKAVKRMVPEIWVCSVVGGMKDELDRRPAWSYFGTDGKTVRWRTFNHIPIYVHRSTAPIKENLRELAVQGIVRGVKDLQRELNKRRTQELRILNTSANSGWMIEENSVVNEDDLEDFGSSPGVVIKYKMGKPKPEKIMPTPLSQGHAQLAAEHTQDMKETLGINTELLSQVEGGQASGRAIALRQKQGLVMVQKIFDNLSQSKRLLGRFILSQLGEIFDVESSMRVLGEAFIKQNFSVPIQRQVVDPASGQTVAVPALDPMTGQPLTQVDVQAAQQTFNEVLNDTKLGKYDVSVGENISSETIQYGQFLELMDMVSKGIPVPPDVIVEESSLSEGQKQKIVSRIQAMGQPAPRPGA